MEATMTVLGLIAEYNPFHHGHKYHLDQSIKKTNAKYSLAVMSGSFLQRGEPSFVDKWTKAKMAVDNGVDLVLELPFVFSTQSAEFFAYGGVKLLESLNIVDYLSFGSELGDLDPLYKIASILLEEPEEFQERLRYYLSLGLSYSVSRSNALEDYIGIISPNDKNNYKDILNKSNNILAIEYLKSLIRIESNIKPLTIKRIGSEYKDLSISHGFASATGIRNLIKKEGLDSVKELVPEKTFESLEMYLDKYNNFNYLENYNQLLLYIIRTITKDDLVNYMDIEPGLDNRMIQQGYKSNEIIDIISSIVTKRYPRTRIQRLFTHLLHELDEISFKELYKEYPSYIRVLAANSNGLHLLKKIKENSTLPIITKFADYKKINNPFMEKALMFDKKSTDLFFLGLPSQYSMGNMDFFISPYIVK